MSETKQKILDTALDLFSQNGYSAVSIKESSVYYHFKNKQAVLDELLQQFEAEACRLMSQLEQAMTVSADFSGGDFFQTTCDCFFEQYLMDDFCNKILRLLFIEQLHSEEMQKIYDYWMFEKPLAFQTQVFSMLAAAGIINQTDSGYLAVKFYAPIFLFAQRLLFCGKLSEEHRQVFRKEAHRHIENFFKEIGGVKLKELHSFNRKFVPEGTNSHVEKGAWL